MQQKTLSELPPELLDQIITHLPSASSLASLSATNKYLHNAVEKSAWHVFARARFPSLAPNKPASSQNGKTVARTLTTLSKAWDRRAFLARHVDPSVGLGPEGRTDVTSWPGGKKVEKWQRPRGQTIGFTPRIDVYESEAGGGRGFEVMAFSAGAEVCLRVRRGMKEVKWVTYRPLSAYEGRDDITSLHLLRPGEGGGVGGGEEAQRMVTGTANGDLRMLRLPIEDGGDTQEVVQTYFTTQGQPVRSSSLLQRPLRHSLLAAAIGDSRIALYNIEDEQAKIAPSSEVDVKAGRSGQTFSKSYRTWSTNFLSDKHVAVGLGSSEEPIRVYTLMESGLDKDSFRGFTLTGGIDLEDRSDELAPGGVATKPLSSVYPVVPLPASSGAQDGRLFLSGSYDGVIRLHDMRSPRDVEGAYVDATDDSSIYSLLPRGGEKVVAGTSRHSLLKVFDLRLGAKCYSYMDAQSSMARDIVNSDDRDASGYTPANWNLFLRPHRASNPSGGRGWGRSGVQESSIYSLAAPLTTSPYLYAGVENAVVEMAFTNILDPHPDSAYFSPWVTADRKTGKGHGQGRSNNVRAWNGWRAKEVLDLAMYEQDTDMRLCTQRSLGDIWKGKTSGFPDGIKGLDERWRLGSDGAAWNRS